MRDLIQFHGSQNAGEAQSDMSCFSQITQEKMILFKGHIDLTSSRRCKLACGYIDASLHENCYCFSGSSGEYPTQLMLLCLVCILLGEIISAVFSLNLFVMASRLGMWCLFIYFIFYLILFFYLFLFYFITNNGQGRAEPMYPDLVQKECNLKLDGMSALL